MFGFLNGQSLELETVPAGTRYFHLYPPQWVDAAGAVHPGTPLGCGFGPTRFSDPSVPPTYRVYYAAEDLRTAVLETVVRDFRTGRLGFIFSRDSVLNRCWAEITLTAPLRLVDLVEDGCTRMGINTDTIGARDHAQGRALSFVLHGHADAPDGILYRSRLSGNRNIAIFDRRFAALDATGDGVMRDRPELPGFIRRYKLNIP
jgi:hypothetical protein